MPNYRFFRNVEILAVLMVVVLYPQVKSKLKEHYKRDQVNDQELDHMENQFRVQVGVHQGSVKFKVRRSTHGQLPNCKNNKPVWQAALDLRNRWNYFVFNVFARLSSGSRRVSNRWWVREGPHRTPLSSPFQRAQVLADNLLMVAVGNPLDKDIIFKGDKAYNRALAHNLCRLRCLRGLL